MIYVLFLLLLTRTRQCRHFTERFTSGLLKGVSPTRYLISVNEDLYGSLFCNAVACSVFIAVVNDILCCHISDEGQKYRRYQNAHFCTVSTNLQKNTFLVHTNYPKRNTRKEIKIFY